MGCIRHVQLYEAWNLEVGISLWHIGIVNLSVLVGWLRKWKVEVGIGHLNCFDEVSRLVAGVTCS